MRYLAAVLLYLLLSGHVLPQAVHSQLAKALKLTISYAPFEGKCIWSLLRAVQCSGPVSSSWVKSSSESFKTSKSLDTAELLQLNSIVRQELVPGSPQQFSVFQHGQGWRAGSSWAAPEETSTVSAGITGTKWSLWKKTPQQIDIDKTLRATESVNSFRIWLNNSSKWEQMIISFCPVGAEGNEWTLAAAVLRSPTEGAAAFGQLGFDFITSVRRLCLDWCFGS